MDEKTKNAIQALAAIIKTDHTRDYLTEHDPQALKQAEAAYYAFEEQHLREARVISMEPMRSSSRVHPGGVWTGDEGEEIL